MSRKILLAALLWCSLLTPSARATLVIYEWSPTEILLASDSLMQLIHPSGKIFGLTECKTRQQGEVFFVFSGVVSLGDGSGNLVPVARQAAQSAGGLAGIVAAFETKAKPHIDRIMARGRDETVSKALGLSEVPLRLDVVFVDSKSHALAHLGYARERDGSALQDIRKVFSIPNREHNITAIGIKEEAAKTVRPGPGFAGVRFITAFFGAQVKHEAARLARGERPRILDDPSILRIAGGKAAWVAGHQGECPAIQ